MIPFTFASEKRVSTLIYNVDCYYMSVAKGLGVLDAINLKMYFFLGNWMRLSRLISPRLLVILTIWNINKQAWN